MDQDLISKKELLERTGISYGQLYRWRRKKLIPEEWFIRKSVFTGQETFFPREKILPRIENIKNMRSTHSLDEMAELFSPHPARLTLTKEELIEREIVSSRTLDEYVTQRGDAETFSFKKVLYLYIFETLLKTGQVTLAEGPGLLQTLEEHYPKFKGKKCKLMLIRKMGVSSFLLLSSPSDVYVENDTNVVIELSVSKCIEKLKQKLM